MRLGRTLERFEVNVIVSQSDHGCDAPVIEELKPAFTNLVGRVEYLQMQGVLITNFRLIKTGASHRANSRTLLLDVRSVRGPTSPDGKIKHQGSITINRSRVSARAATMSWGVAWGGTWIAASALVPTTSRRSLNSPR